MPACLATPLKGTCFFEQSYRLNLVDNAKHLQRKHCKEFVAKLVSLLYFIEVYICFTLCDSQVIFFVMDKTVTLVWGGGGEGQTGRQTETE